MVPTRVRINELSFETKLNLLTKIKVTIDTGEANYFTEGDISYGWSFKEDRLIVSTSEVSIISNTSIYPFHIQYIREPDFSCVKESSLDPKSIIFYMGWAVENIPEKWFNKKNEETCH